VPYVGKHAKQLFVFKRTPSSVDLRGNSPTDPEWAKSLKPGWQHERRENFNGVVTGKPFQVDLVADGWTNIFRNLMSMIPKSGVTSVEEAAELAELADFQKMNKIRAWALRSCAIPIPRRR
jgi:cyclohexanone monooxygenase